MKKGLCIILAALLGLGLAGCAKKEETGPFEAQNEILTYCKIDPQKTQLTVSRTGNVEIKKLCAAFEERNPDVQVIYLDVTGGNQITKPVAQWVEHGCAPDVMITTAPFLAEEATIRYFENLSANPIIQNYEAAALQRTSLKANVYWLPGPSNINAIIYNKTLFQQYGWTVPATFDAFVALCARIREDTGGAVEPWNPNAKYTNELQIAMEGFTYEELFAGVDNRSWYNSYVEGKAVFTGHMEPYYTTLQKLVENGILRPEHFTYSATTRGKEFAAGKIAMVNMVISAMDNDQYDFAYMPFPATKGTLGYVCDTYSCMVGVPKKEHTDKQRDAIDRFLAYFSSEEGQRVYIGDSIKVSNVKNVSINQSEDLAALLPSVKAGHMFENLDLHGKANVSVHQNAKDMAEGVKTAADCIADVDAQLSAAPTSPQAEEPQEVVATAKQDFTILETSFYIADAYREAAEADIGLIAHGAAYRGNLMRIFTGELTPSFVSVLKPRSFENQSTLVKLLLTGKQLTEALNAPLESGWNEEGCIYAYSGLKCQVAPWNEPGKKYLSVTLADGAAIDPERAYTVAAWAGTIADEYITEVLQTYEGAWEEMMTEKLQREGTISPAQDRRIKLVWK